MRPMMIAPRVVMCSQELHIFHTRKAFQESLMVALDHRNVMRHACVAQFLEPFARIAGHSRQSVGGHQVALWFDGFAFAGSEKIFAVQPPETENRHRHSRADGCLDYRRLFDVEMSRDARTSGRANRLAQRNGRRSPMPERDCFLVVLEPVRKIAVAQAEMFYDPRGQAA